jgi:hypothetical protein
MEIPESKRRIANSLSPRRLPQAISQARARFENVLELRFTCCCSLMVKVVHIPFTFAPDPIGGTEIYSDWSSASVKWAPMGSYLGAAAKQLGIASAARDV